MSSENETIFCLLFRLSLFVSLLLIAAFPSSYVMMLLYSSAVDALDNSTNCPASFLRPNIERLAFDQH